MIILILISILLSLTYGLVWIGAILGSSKLRDIEKRLFPILKDSIEAVTPIIHLHHEKIVVGIFFSISRMPGIVEDILNTMTAFLAT